MRARETFHSTSRSGPPWCWAFWQRCGRQVSSPRRKVNAPRRSRFCWRIWPQRGCAGSSRERSSVVQRYRTLPKWGKTNEHAKPNRGGPASARFAILGAICRNRRHLCLAWTAGGRDRRNRAFHRLCSGRRNRDWQFRRHRSAVRGRNGGRDNLLGDHRLRLRDRLGGWRRAGRCVWDRRKGGISWRTSLVAALAFWLLMSLAATAVVPPQGLVQWIGALLAAHVLAAAVGTWIARRIFR